MKKRCNYRYKPFKRLLTVQVQINTHHKFPHGSAALGIVSSGNEKTTNNRLKQILKSNWSL